MTNSPRGASIVGWGSALPDNVVTNDDLAERLETNNEWIVERTGIRERRIGGTTSELAIAAAKQALERASITPQHLDAIVVATITPDQTFPAVATQLAEALDFHGGTFDLNAACSGFVYALVTASGLLATGLDRILVVGAETMSQVTDQSDRRTAILFGDGAGAVVLQATAEESSLLGFDFGTEAKGRGLLYADEGEKLQMDGKEVFRRAVRATVESSKAALEKAKVTVNDIALFVPHQANLRIIEAVNQRLGIDLEHTAVMVERTGNTSAASIPLALAEAADNGRLAPGDLVLLSGFGAGMSWASAVWRWSA